MALIDPNEREPSPGLHYLYWVPKEGLFPGSVLPSADMGKLGIGVQGSLQGCVCVCVCVNKFTHAGVCVCVCVCVNKFTHDTD